MSGKISQGIFVQFVEPFPKESPCSSVAKNATLSNSKKSCEGSKFLSSKLLRREVI